MSENKPPLVIVPSFDQSKLTQAKLDQAARLFGAGWSSDAIADECSVGIATIRQNIMRVQERLNFLENVRAFGERSST